MNRIVCAANLYNDGTLIIGARHFDRIMHQTMALIPNKEFKKLGHQQGFIDKFGDFKTRQEAFLIAKDAGQIIQRCGGDDGKLFSENLY
jgi:hypothetical protein